MDYEKAYKEAIKRAKVEQETFFERGNISAKTAIERIFPELCESEDEGIRKELIQYLKDYPNLPNGNYCRTDFFAWLERQGEQNHTDKAEPKFKVGDWVVNKASLKIYQVYCIDNSEYNYITYSCKPLFDTNDDWPCFHEDMIRLWTIQDAKDGDVLSTGNPFIFRGFGDRMHPNNPTAYCGINTSNTFVLAGENDWWTSNAVHPATKEQRDLLFQKMHEAGYKWDAEKKELKKIEQASDWSEEDDYILNLVSKFVSKGYKSHPKIPSLEFIQEWLKSLKSRPQWKPKGQQLECLRHMINASTVNKIDKQFVEDLYGQLIKYL